MRRDPPARASLEHLKKQAKDLLDAHRRAEPEALARIRAAVPAFAAKSDEAIARARFALHDAQSAIAREYGRASWAEARKAVAAQKTENAPSDALLRALMLPMPFPPEVGARLREAAGNRTLAAAAAGAPFPASLPVVALRDAMILPRAVGPIHVARRASRIAIDAALEKAPPTIAVFSQRAVEKESPGMEDLHPIGCETYVHAFFAGGPAPAGPATSGSSARADRAWVVLEGVRWVELEGLAGRPDGSLAARVKPVVVEPGDPAEVAPLAASLRARVRDLASAFPDSARLVALVDSAEPEHLADLVVANLRVSVADKARYASELRLVERLRIASALVEGREKT